MKKDEETSEWKGKVKRGPEWVVVKALWKELAECFKGGVLLDGH